MLPAGSLVGPDTMPVSAMEWGPESSEMFRSAMAWTNGCTFTCATVTVKLSLADAPSASRTVKVSTTVPNELVVGVTNATRFDPLPLKTMPFVGMTPGLDDDAR